MSHWKDFLDLDAPGGRYLPWKEVARATGLSRTTAWRLQKRDDFPAPYAISPGRVGYRETEVQAWCVSRNHRAARNPAPPDLGAKHVLAAALPSAEPRRVLDASPADVRRPSGAGEGSSAKSLKPRIRRSEHARAIAQQMLFDF